MACGTRHLGGSSGVEAPDRRHLAGIWEEASARRHLGGGIWEEASTLGFPPQSRRCLLEVLGRLTNTVRVPSDRELRFYVWKRPGTSGSIVEAPVGMWIHSGTTPSKTSQKYNSAHHFLHYFRQDLTLRGARWLSDRFLYLLAHCWCLGTPLGTTLGHQKRVLGTTLAHLRKTPKTTKMITCWVPVLKTRFNDFFVFSELCFYMSFRGGR